MSDFFPRPEFEPMFPSSPASYLQDLNTPQRQAVETLDGPLLVLAGAGTGKTRVLTTRIVHILALKKAWPSQILAVTFTNKAAQEMRQRIGQFTGDAIEGLWLGTFHAMAVKILRRHAEYVGLTSAFTILDADDQLRLIKQILKAEQIDDKRYPPRLVQTAIDRWKDRGYLSDNVPLHELNQESSKTILQLYKVYQARLKTLNVVDFGDLLLHCIDLFSRHDDILKKYQTQFRYVLVDEYQDTNVAQYLWLRLLAMGHTQICCVGDDDQSIYGWRGAEVTNILRFEHDFPGATVIRLEENYRSTPEILAAASTLIAYNQSRLGKTLWTKREKGEKVSVYALWSGEEEAHLVGEVIEHLHQTGQSLSNMAILVRAGHQTREFEDRLLALGIPYRMIGGLKFYERLEIRDALAYLKVVFHPEDSLSFERIVNIPRRGVGSAALQILHQHARENQLSFYQATQHALDNNHIRGTARTGLKTFLECLDRWNTQMSAVRPSELATLVLNESGYLPMWRQDKSPDASGRVENLKEFISALNDFEHLGDFLEHVALVTDNNRKNPLEGVNLMTLHSAKGLEFETVFLPGWEEGLFPHGRALEGENKNALEEERRLAYVGLTRARKHAYISCAANRCIHGIWQSSVPSRFLSELPEDIIDVLGPLGFSILSKYKK